MVEGIYIMLIIKMCVLIYQYVNLLWVTTLERFH